MKTTKSRKTEAQRKVTHARKYGAKSPLPKRQNRNLRKSI